MSNAIAITKPSALGNLFSKEYKEYLDAEGKKMYDAKNKMRIADIPTNDAVRVLNNTFYYIALDTGYKIPDETKWQYIKTRLYGLLKEYYGGMTISEIQLAFELCIMGKLDDYLPKDKSGNADRNHYQTFNGEYFAKILNAYKRKRDAVFAPIAERAEANKVLEYKESGLNEWTRRTIRDVIYTYKYRGTIDEHRNGLHFVYEWLIQRGYASEVVATQEERHKAFMRYRKRVQQGLENKVQAVYNIKQGENAKHLQADADLIAMTNEIKRAIEELIENEYDYGI